MQSRTDSQRVGGGSDSAAVPEGAVEVSTINATHFPLHYSDLQSRQTIHTGEELRCISGRENTMENVRLARIPDFLVLRKMGNVACT